MKLKPQGRCIFCDGFGLSKEHLFADWLRLYFPRTSSDTHTFGSIEWLPVTKVATKRNQGHSGSRKVRKICKSCNNGWISIIDEAAKRAAPPVFQGTIVQMDVTLQKTIAVWLSKIAMVGDTIDPSKSVVPQQQRTWLKEHSEPPVGWEVWLASYHGSSWRDLAIYQQSGKLTIPPPVAGPEPIESYVGATTIGIGSMLALVIGTDHPALGLDIGDAANLLTRIWPTQAMLEWPTVPVLSDQQAGGISYILNSMRMNPIALST